MAIASYMIIVILLFYEMCIRDSKGAAPGSYLGL